MSGVDISYDFIYPTYRDVKRVLVFDVETTGLLPSKPEIVPMSELPHITQLSFALYNVDERVIEELYSSFCWLPAGFKLEPKVTELTGITDEMCLPDSDSSVFVLEAIGKLYDAYNRCDCLVAHNIRFDSAMIQIELARWRCSTPMANFLKNPTVPSCCTMFSSIKLCNIRRENSNAYKFPKLSELHQFLFSSIPEGLHNSLIDVLACLRCFCSLKLGYELHPAKINVILRRIGRGQSPLLRYDTMISQGI